MVTSRQILIKVTGVSLVYADNGCRREIDITAEDAVIIKEAVSGLTPGCYSQVVKLIEK